MSSNFPDPGLIRHAPVATRLRLATNGGTDA